MGVAHQYCGQVGKQDNCRVAVSLSVATWNASLPVGYRLYLPKEWAEDAERRKETEVPKEVRFQTKPEIALDRIRAAVAGKVDRGVVLADAAYSIDTEFRDGLTELGLQYAVGVQSTMTVWEPGKQPLPAKPRGRAGRPPRLLQRTTNHHPVSVKQLAMSLPSSVFREVTWREAGERKLRSRFAAVRVASASPRHVTRNRGTAVRLPGEVSTRSLGSNKTPVLTSRKRPSSMEDNGGSVSPSLPRRRVERTCNPRLQPSTPNSTAGGAAWVGAPVLGLSA